MLEVMYTVIYHERKHLKNRKTEIAFVIKNST